MIRDLGNCGNIEKRFRVLKAIKTAKENKCAMRIILDPLVYTDGTISFKADDIREYEFACDQDTLYISQNGLVKARLPWWDIDRVVLIW